MSKIINLIQGDIQSIRLNDDSVVVKMRMQKDLFPGWSANLRDYLNETLYKDAPLPPIRVEQRYHGGAEYAISGFNGHGNHAPIAIEQLTPVILDWMQQHNDLHQANDKAVRTFSFPEAARTEADTALSKAASELARTAQERIAALKEKERLATTKPSLLDKGELVQFDEAKVSSMAVDRKSGIVVVNGIPPGSLQQFISDVEIAIANEKMYPPIVEIEPPDNDRRTVRFSGMKEEKMHIAVKAVIDQLANTGMITSEHAKQAYYDYCLTPAGYEPAVSLDLQDVGRQ